MSADDSEGVPLTENFAIGIAFGNSNSSIAYTSGVGLSGCSIKLEIKANESWRRKVKRKSLRMKKGVSNLGNLLGRSCHELSPRDLQTVKYLLYYPTPGGKNFMACKPRINWCEMQPTRLRTFEIT